MKILLAVLALATGPEASAPFTLALGETVVVDGFDLSLTFTAVPRDSRCPRDVNCIVAGEAVVIFDVERTGETSQLTFEIPPGGEDAQELDGLTITITSLEPETDSTKRIDPSDYTATVVVKNGDSPQLLD